MNCNARSNAQFNGLDFYALICQLAIKFGLNPTLTIPNTFLMTPKDGQLCLINQSNLLVDLKKKRKRNSQLLLLDLPHIPQRLAHK